MKVSPTSSSQARPKNSLGSSVEGAKPFRPILPLRFGPVGEKRFGNPSQMPWRKCRAFSQCLAGTEWLGIELLSELASNLAGVGCPHRERFSAIESGRRER